MRLHQLQDTADDIQSAVRDQATALAEQTREGFKGAQKAVSGWEHSMEKSVRSNPGLFMGGALALIGLLLLKMYWDSRSE
ncbi:MAG: hypothetical protein NTZ46_12180 [Verrucomicrobia bacterium]|nr:hypothetical protein [Verrucomicrobiota bacterium]